MIDRYNPLKTPDPQEWLALDEGERLRMVEDYHRRVRVRVRLANAKAHAVMHVIIENQIALGDETPVQLTAQRLMDEGLDRHDTIHAIGSVLVGYMFDLTRRPATGGDPNQPYFAELERLTAERWR